MIHVAVEQYRAGDILVVVRIASPEMLPSVDLLPHQNAPIVPARRPVPADSDGRRRHARFLRYVTLSSGANADSITASVAPNTSSCALSLRQPLSRRCNVRSSPTE